MADLSGFGKFGATIAKADGAAATLYLLQPSLLSEHDLARWNELAAGSATESAFSQPWFLRAAFAHCDPDQTALLAIAELPDGTWAGAFPIARSNHHGRAPLPNWHSWRHPNQFVAAPLVRKGLALVFWQTLLDGLARESGAELALCLADLPIDDPVSVALFDVCASESRKPVVDRRIERPALNTKTPPMQEPKLRRRLASLERKLAREQGAPHFAITRDAAEIEQQIEAFLTLEQSGWKGTQGSALACSAATRRLFGAIAREGSLRGKIELASLRAGGQLLAASILLVGQGRSYGFKMAYDERAAGSAPGLLLLNWLTARHCESGGEQLIDSCTAPGSQPASRLWPDSCGLIDCRIALGGPMRRGAMLAVTAAEGAYSWLKRRGAVAAEPAKS